MTNADVAEAFQTIAKILEFKGENPFRIRAYLRAAETVGSLTRNLEDIYAEGGVKALREIAGIGEDLSLKIEEMVKTGSLAYIQELTKDVPPGVLAIMELEGVGPKKAKQLFDLFRVKDIPGLEKLADSGKLEELKGWGKTSAANVLRSIRQKRDLSVRATIGTALPLAETIAEALRASRLCGRVEIAGSLRRRKETIGDIDILVTSTTPAKVMEMFCALPGVLRVIGKGPTKSSVLLASGIQCDLRVVEEAVFGPALYYFTGSKDHNVTVRTLAQKKGMTINEYGVFKGSAEKKGKSLAAATEEEVFRVVGLPYIPPELRENRGEVAAAQNGTLPHLIEGKDLRGDLHLHSDFSDGSADMKEMAAAARDAGLEYIAITDHASSMGMVKGIKEKNIKDYLQQIEAARKAVPGIHILAGAEVDIEKDGSLYLSDGALRQLDWVVASIHGRFRQTCEEMTARILKALSHPAVRVLGHPTARLLGKRPGVEMDFEEVLQQAKKLDIAFELNASAERLDLDDIHCKRAREVGVKISINSDAHGVEGFQYRFGISQARRGWLTASDVINTLPWKEFQNYLKSH